MPKFDPEAVDTHGLDLTEWDVSAVPEQGEVGDHDAPPEGFEPDEDALAPGAAPTVEEVLA